MMFIMGAILWLGITAVLIVLVDYFDSRASMQPKKEINTSNSRGQCDDCLGVLHKSCKSCGGWGFYQE